MVDRACAFAAHETTMLLGAWLVVWLVAGGAVGGENAIAGIGGAGEGHTQQREPLTRRGSHRGIARGAHQPLRSLGVPPLPLAKVGRRLAGLRLGSRASPERGISIGG